MRFRLLFDKFLLTSPIYFKSSSHKTVEELESVLKLLDSKNSSKVSETHAKINKLLNVSEVDNVIEECLDSDVEEDDDFAIEQEEDESDADEEVDRGNMEDQEIISDDDSQFDD